MSTTTMHFGPEWMRPKQQSVSRTQPPPPSPPPAAIPQTPNASSYSALVSPAPPAQPEKRDEAHPFRYSKEEMLRIYKEGGKGGLGLEVERWEGVVREVGTDPIGLREMGDAEKKLFTNSLNSDLRRRQSNDYLNLNTQNLERPRLTHSSTGSATGSPLRERYGSMGIIPRRRDSTDQAPTLAPRKLSLSGQQPLGSPRDVGLPSPRRLGHTPSFDGVLNGGESWVARRRASEGLGKIAGVTREPSGEENEIREEEEEGRAEADKETKPQETSVPLAQSGPPTEGSGIALQRPEDITNGIAQLSVDQNSQAHLNSPNPPQTSAPPPSAPADLASVEWSYLDPQGQIQGPFRADLMQKWNDEGYFAPDLLMKRTTLDTEWTSVAELARRTGGGKMFLSPMAPPMPPGLSRRTDSPFGVANEQNMFNNSPYQPSPIRSIRSSTLDSYIGTGSNPSDSPASSFGAGRFNGNGSPDPAAFGGRVGQYGAGDIGTGRVGGYGMAGDSSPAMSGRRNTFADSVEYRSPNLSNMLPQRGSTVDNGFGMNGGAGGFNSPWQSGGFDGLNGGRSSADSSGYQTGFGNSPGLVMNAASLTNNSFADIPGSAGGYRVNDFGYGTPGNQQGISSQDRILGGFSRPAALYNDPSSQTLLGSPGPQYNVNQQQHIPTAIPDLFDPSQARQIHNQFTPSTAQEPVVTASPWGAVDVPTDKRPGPFDSPHPTSANTTIASSTQSSPWGTGLQASNQQVAEQPRGEILQDLGAAVSPTSPLQQEAATAAVAESVAQEVIAVDPLPDTKIEASPPPAPAVEEPLPIVSEQAPAVPKAKLKSTQPQQQQRPSVEPVIQAQNQAIQQSISSPSQPTPTTPKAPWAKDDETKKAPTATSLRQIQDAEAKKAEARKVAEREREKERAARTTAAATTGNEDVQSFTTSWGLPTSQAGRGASSNVVTPSKEVPPTAAPPAPAVWTGATKAAPAKKTMKEIQEEEERRKKANVATSAKESGGGAPAAATPRRGYAESTNKPAPPTVQGSAWTTVGPSGKAVAAAPSRPPVASSASASAVPRTNGTASTVARPPPQPSSAVKPSASKVEEFPLPPSNDFMRWLGDNMKALNSSVNVEEIMHMLLSFPLDPDPSTTEIISEMIYANSQTLDGRRFAADFVSKRKADAAARSKGGANGGGKPISIADVVKAQPKQQTSEWGGFKVVNKKKKGGRS